MTEREMLELAAKAAVISGEWARWHQAYGDEWVEGLNCGGRFLWNPLTDDGDALRLAVDLGMDLQLEGEMNSPHAVSVCEMKSGAFAREALSNDRRSSTRRAIVRAAAEIGKAMP